MEEEPALVSDFVVRLPPITLPRTPAGVSTSAWLGSLNSGDIAAMRTFAATHLGPEELKMAPAEQQAVRQQMLHFMTGGLVSVRVGESHDHRLIAYLQAQLTGEWLVADVTVEPAAPHRVTRFERRFVPPPDDVREAVAPLQPHHGSEFVEALGTYLSALAEADTFSGAVLVARNGETVFARALGRADRRSGTPNRVDTRFNLGSMNKMFTSVAVAQLAERGLLEYDHPVRPYLPGYAQLSGDAADRVTIHHLLTHTSGLGDYFGPRFFGGGKDTLSAVPHYFPLFADCPLAFAPGTRWRYSNAGYVVLGAIIEHVSGRSYFEHVTERVLVPAGMSSTDWPEREQHTPDLAIGYTRGPSRGTGDLPALGPWRENVGTLPSKGGPAGGGYSTVGDLLRFAEALRQERLLGPAMSDLVTAGKVDTDRPGARYAYGFFDERAGSGRRARVVWHGGGAPGINGQFEIYPELGYTVAVLANQDLRAAETVGNALREAIANAHPDAIGTR